MEIDKKPDFGVLSEEILKYIKIFKKSYNQIVNHEDFLSYDEDKREDCALVFAILAVTQEAKSDTIKEIENGD